MNYKKKYLKYKKKYLKLKKIYGGSSIEDIDMEDIEVTEEYLRDLQEAYNKLRLDNIYLEEHKNFLEQELGNLRNAYNNLLIKYNDCINPNVAQVAG